MEGSALSSQLGEWEFERISRMVSKICGIQLNFGKASLIQSRLIRRLQALKLKDFKEYVRYVEADASGREQVLMLDALSTNKTSFFREPRHFAFLKETVLPATGSEAYLRVWSAGCSSGEEAYSLAMFFKENARPERKTQPARVLATDISTGVLLKAKRGVYGKRDLNGISPILLSRYFNRLNPIASEPNYEVKPEVRHLISFARLNLMDAWPMKGPFDVIFCRNVMIYFDRMTQVSLVRRFHEMLAPGGYLFIGHSESLTGLSQDFHYVQPAVYRKE